MAAPAPEVEVEAEPEPAIPPSLSKERFMQLQSVCCEIPDCRRYLIVDYIPDGNKLHFKCPIAAHKYTKDVVNKPPEAYLIPEIEGSPKTPVIDTVRIRCPNYLNAAPNVLPCQGQKCSFFKRLEHKGLMEFLVCTTCCKYWRVT